MRVKNKIPEGIQATEEGRKLYEMLPHMKLLCGLKVEELKLEQSVPVYEVTLPSEEYHFLHEAAVIEYHGILFAAWYNNHRIELEGRTPIRYATSEDGVVSVRISCTLC